MHRRTFMLAFLAMSIPALAVTGELTTAEATRTVRIASHITIKSKELSFSGRVTSSKPACRGSRTVTLYRTPSQALGSTATSSSGSWSVTASGSAGITLGRFYAKVAARSEGTAGTIYVCKAARSKTIAYKP